MHTRHCLFFGLDDDFKCGSDFTVKSFSTINYTIKANLRNTLAGLASSVLKVLLKAIAHKIYRENFRVSSKVRENFSR